MVGSPGVAPSYVGLEPTRSYTDPLPTTIDHTDLRLSLLASPGFDGKDQADSLQEVGQWTLLRKILDNNNNT